VRYRDISIYTDGACYNNGKLNARCGSGIWFAPNDPRNDTLRIPGPHQSNQIGEIAAVIQAISATPRFRPLIILSDSKHVINGLTNHLSTWEDVGWIGIKNADFFKRAAYLLKSRTTTTHFRWVKGHNGDQGNEECDRLAKIGANKPLPDALTMDIPATFDLQGAKLSALNQAIAYRGIRERQPHLHRATTSENLQTTREAIHRYNGLLETNGTIWSGMRRHTLRTRIKQFLYKAMHGTRKVGKYWQRIPDNEQREFCKTCRVTESMEHIPVHCQAAPRRIIWTLAEELWPHTQTLWPEIGLGIILGCGTTTLPPEENQESPNERGNIAQRTEKRGARRLLQILLSEAAYLIWVLRCERVIGDSNEERIHTDREIQTRWLRVINARLTEDKITATKVKRDEKSLHRVKETWKPILTRSADLPHNWVYNREVLVGR
jgi:ribonuclease HI